MCLCGHNIVGHPTQFKMRTRLHRKVCSLMTDEIAGDATGSFNNTIVDTNGWKGQGDDGKAAKQVARVYTDGVYIGDADVKTVKEAVKSK